MLFTPSTRDRAPVAPVGGHTFLLPDGSRVTLDAAGLDASRPWNCLFVVPVHGTRQAFTVTRRGAADRLIARLGLSNAQTHSYGTAELVLGHDAERHEMMATWRGPWHEMINFRSGPRLGPDSFTRVFDAFSLTDTHDGLLLRPRSRRQIAFEPLRVLKEIPGIGDLRIERPHEAEIPAPRWRGAPARNGEIWRRPMPNGEETGRARSELLILATPTAVTQLMPGPEDTADDTAAAEFLANLNVSWTPA